MRPLIEIEKVKKALEEKRSSLLYGHHTCPISQGTIDTLIALCDYALELEAENERLSLVIKILV